MATSRSSISDVWPPDTMRGAQAYLFNLIYEGPYDYEARPLDGNEATKAEDNSALVFLQDFDRVVQNDDDQCGGHSYSNVWH